MKVYQEVEIQGGKMTLDRQKFADRISLLQDGRYILSISNYVPKTLEEYREMYFAKCGTVAKEIGETKNAIHKLYLGDTQIESTNSLSYEDWEPFIKTFNMWAFVHYNVII